MPNKGKRQLVARLHLAGLRPHIDPQLERMRAEMAKGVRTMEDFTTDELDALTAKLRGWVGDGCPIN